MTKTKVLILGSNATKIELRGGGSATIGQYLNETAVPALALIDAGYEVVLATPDGTKPHIDAVSDTIDHFGGDQAAYDRAKRFFAEHPAMNAVRTLRSVVAAGLDDYAGVFVPGGHAPVVDLMQDRDAGAILRHFHGAAKPTALLCHGPVVIAAALSDAPAFRAALIDGDDGKAADLAEGWIYAGYRMTVFSAITRSAAISLFDMPRATSRRTSSSRSVSFGTPRTPSSSATRRDITVNSWRSLPTIDGDTCPSPRYTARTASARSSIDTSLRR